MTSLFAVTVLHAQTNIDWNSASDTKVMLHAVEQTTPAPASSAPRYGNFYSAQHAPGTAQPWPPLPGNLKNLNWWNLGDGFILLDDLDVNYNAPLRTTGKTMTMGAMDAPLPPGGGGSGDGLTYPTWIAPTNGLWLELTNVSNGTAYLNLHNATNTGVDFYGGVYEIFSKTNLLQDNWDIASEVLPTNTNCQPFDLQLSTFNPQLFVWARDWTGITSNGNTTPDWWFWLYFHETDLSDTNFDSSGENTLLFDYENDLDPNTIQFSLQFNNTESNVTTAYSTVAVQSGAPSYVAILINDTNQADANWQPYDSTNIAIPLNSGDGLYNVQVGLRGLPSDARQSWAVAQLILDTSVPVFSVTNPVASVVSTPMIQLQGMVSASLSSLTYDVSNALGVATNQSGYWQPAFYDTNLLIFTTNTFQCYDILLTNGLNTITLHATDIFGNSIVTNFNYTLDYSGDHAAPMLSLVWPTNGTVIAGSNVTVQAQVDDETATITASINSDTNIIQGIVERSGAVWFNDLPLNSGTNVVVITAMDAAGNTSTTNFNIIQSSAVFTINPISGDQLNQANVTVTGTIDASNDIITINGVAATVSGGTWTATNVPVSDIGTAMLNAQVTDSGDNLIGTENIYQSQPAKVTLESYQLTVHNRYTRNEIELYTPTIAREMP